MATVHPTSTVAQRDASRPLDVAARDNFLAYFEPKRRSYITNAFLHPVREGVRTAVQVLAAVEAEIRVCQERPRRWHFTDDQTRFDDAAAVIRAHRAEALAFAQYALDYELLPAAERARLKAAKGEPYKRAWLGAHPATEKQRAFLKALGHTGDVTSMLEASELIERLRTGKGVQRV